MCDYAFAALAIYVLPREGEFQTLVSRGSGLLVRSCGGRGFLTFRLTLSKAELGDSAESKWRWATRLV